MNALHANVAAFVERHGLHADVPHRVLDVVSEVGEVAKEVLTSTGYGKRPFTASPALAGELGDALFSLLCVANLAGVDAERAVEAAMAKYRRRLAARADASSSASVE